MGIIPDINQFSAALDALQTIFAQGEADALDEGHRQQMSLLSAQLKETQTEFMAEYPKAMASLKQDLDTVQQQSQETLEKVKQLRKDQEEAAQVPKAPAPPTEDTLDPTLGQKLRVELLERFGNGVQDKKELTSKNISRSEFYEMLRKSGVIK